VTDAEARARAALRDVRRIVVKVGTSTLIRDGQLQADRFDLLAEQIARLASEGREVVLVSSGAIAVGSARLGWRQPGRSIPEKQAAAAVGQIGLVERYQGRFARHGRMVAQVLLTAHGLQERERFLNARHTLNELLKLGVVPIVNENDTVATEEIRFGDNDNLSATVVSLVAAGLLILLTDVEGFYERPPVPGEPAPPLLSFIPRISEEVQAAARGSDSAFGRGGMLTKLQAAATAASSGAATLIADGSRPDTLLRAAAGEPVGTLVQAGERLASRKHWLAFTARTRGELVLDEGATRALRERGMSLLPAGIVEVRGRFRIGDSVQCLDPQGREVARGLCAYAAEEVVRIKGLATREIEAVLGYSNGDAVIHRDDLVLTGSPSP